jgi:hypothetical protein
MVHRNALIGLALAAATFAAASFVYRDVREVEVDFERGYEGAFVEKFHPRERTGEGYFRWTRETSYVVLRHLPASGSLAFEARIRTVRPAGEPLPMLTFTANGVTVHRTQALPGLVVYRFELPSTAALLKLGIESEPFEAGGGRMLGVQVLGIRASFDRSPDAFPAASWFALAAIFLFLGQLFAGVSLLFASLTTAALSASIVHLTTCEAVRFSAFPRDAAVLAAALLVASVLMKLVFDRAAWLHRSERAVATALLSILLFVKLGAMSYPLTLSSDADFQANRMRMFLAGNLYPTSVTQHDPPFRFPYPVALYFVAAPLARMGVELVPALEVVTVLFDVLVSGLLLYLAKRYLDDFRAGAIAAVLYQLVPMNTLSFSAGNFTNLFAVSMLAASFALVSIAVSTGSRGAIAGAALTAFGALTAHFGMLIEGVVLWPVWIALLFLGPAPVRDRRVPLAAALLLSFLLAFGYYLGYLDLVTSQWGRAVSAESAVAPGASLALALEQIGAVFLLTSVLGSIAFLRKPFGSPLATTACGWFLVTALFFALSLLTAVEVRYWLQALPVLALFSGVYLSRASERGPVGKTAAIAAIAYIAFDGLSTLYQSVLFRYH